MAKYIISGGNKLNGKIRISGNKNAILPCIAAALLTSEEVTLKNVPQIADVAVMIETLQSLGVWVNREEDVLKIKATEIKTSELPKELTSKLRASVLLVGPLLSRSGKAQFFHPGGDIIGKRNINTHLKGFEQIGYNFKIDDREYKIERSKNFTDQKTVFLEEPSVTGTENLILASVLGGAKITLKNCAQEPHIVDLCLMLNKMGAKIEGIGSQTLNITGVKKLGGCEFSVGSDYVEMATYAIAAVLTGGKIEIENCNLEGMEPITMPLQKMGIKLSETNHNSILVSYDTLQSIHKLTVNIWPGFPTDLMSVFIVLATQAKGVSLLHDWMYESRMFFVDKLITMGAHITVADPHRVVVYGPTSLKARELETPDIRAGMALVLAALIAKGESVINRSELIERGYEDAVSKLTSLGADIKRVE